MYGQLINVLNEKLKECEESVRLTSAKVREVKEIYDIIKPKGVFNLDYVTSVFDDEDKVKKINAFFMERNTMLVELINKRLECVQFKKNREMKTIKMGIIPQNFLSDRSLDLIKKKTPGLYKNIIEMRKYEEELNEASEIFLSYIGDLVTEMYERLLQEKEEKKSYKKLVEHAVKDMRRKTALFPKEIATVTNVIDSIQEEDERATLFSLLNSYVVATDEKKQTSVKKAPVSKSTNKVVKYVDLNLPKDEEMLETHDDEDVHEDIYDNYLLALKGFDNYADVSVFLSAIISAEPIDITIKKLLNRLSTEDDELKQYLLTYANGLNNEEKEDSDEINNITVLYYGFNFGKNKILDDIKKHDIPSDYYQDVLKGIRMIEKDGAINRRNTFAQIKKLFKLRVNDIRITYKRLDKNLYIIYGVFCKKDNKGLDVISTTIKRNNNFATQEKSIVDARGFDELWQELMSSNDAMTYDIKCTLSDSKVKK